MRLYVFAVIGLVACGDVKRQLPDAPNAPLDGMPDGPVDGPLDAPPQACTHVPATSTSQTVLSYTLTGGAFQSFGCAPVDPTYWLSASGMSVRVTFVTPQARPSIRVWGMNTDDTASMMVNGAAYTLNTTSASLAPKVVCGQSPGPDGVAFVGGSLTGANTPTQGNYSYQDVTIEQTAVTSIELAGLTGAGWGFAGATVGNCAPTL
jgi:hypothetical protein